MDPLRSAVIECRNSTADDDAFITRLNQQIAEGGSEFCINIFQTLASLDLPLETAKKYWFEVVEHRRFLADKLLRPVDLITAMSDYLRTATAHHPHARLVEMDSYEKIIHDTMHDSLTGLFNRLYFNETYEQQISLAKRYNTDLSVLFLDIDNFKDINDSLGHIAGDIALQQVASIIREEKRDSDIAARYGGEEFVLLMPHTENVNAYVLAERIRRQIESTIFNHRGQEWKLTISGGLASFPLDAEEPKNLLDLADSALYFAKGAGKNTISLYKKDKRRYLRVKLCQPVLVQELGFNSSQVFSCISKDIGIGGILFDNAESLPIGSRIKVSVPIGSSPPILLIGRVVRVEAFSPNSFDIGMAISFKEMDKLASHQIASFLRET